MAAARRIVAKRPLDAVQAHTGRFWREAGVPRWAVGGTVQIQQGQHEIVAADGRQLRVETSGPVHGTPVFLLHGTPGSRNGPRPRSTVLYRLGVRLISYDRPGYGGSTRQPDRRVADAARDVTTIADALDLAGFAVVGRSGGGPHALACKALLGDRVLRVAVLVGLAPSNAGGLDWFDGMAAGNVRDYATAARDTFELTEELRARAARTVADPESLLEALHEQMSPPDRRVITSVAYRRLLSQSYAEALRAGPYGWIDDVLALRDDWGFSLDEIRGPVRLWHGADDTFSPPKHSLWLARQIPGAEVQVQSDTAHFGALEVLPRMLNWLAA
jgi:pimeloyl-ACP methyl ester carboxylesterase